MDSSGRVIGYSQVTLEKPQFLSLRRCCSPSVCSRAELLQILIKPSSCRSQVDRMASLYNIHVRTGCFCNTGACQSFLGITNQQMKRNLQV